MAKKKTGAQLDREIAEALSSGVTTRRVTLEDLTPRQRGLLRDLRRAKEYGHPLSVEVSKDDVARQLAALGLLRVEPDDDLGLTWVTVTARGRDVATKGGLWGRGAHAAKTRHAARQPTKPTLKALDALAYGEPVSAAVRARLVREGLANADGRLTASGQEALDTRLVREVLGRDHSTKHESDEEKVAAAVKRFPGKFGLRAFPGDVFRVSPTSSYMGSGGVQLYTERLVDGKWLSFAKGTERELRSQIVELD